MNWVSFDELDELFGITPTGNGYWDEPLDIQLHGPRFNRTGILHSEETKKLISDKLKGYKRDPEVTKKIVESRRKTGFSTTHRAIKCVETGAVYYSIKDAAKRLGSEYTNFAKHLRGKTKKHKGLTYVYCDVTM